MLLVMLVGLVLPVIIITTMIISTICPHVGMNQFGQMGMQSMGQGSTPPLPLNPQGNQVSTCCIADY